MQWLEQTKPAALMEHDGRGTPVVPAHAATDAYNTDVDNDAQRSAAIVTAHPERLLLLASTAGLGGLLLCSFFAIAGARRRRVYLDRRGTDWNARVAYECIPSAFDGTIAAPRWPAEAADGPMRKPFGRSEMPVSTKNGRNQ